MTERAEIIQGLEPLFFKAQIQIHAPANAIFDFIAAPENHSKIDGSGMVKGAISGPAKLYLGAKFGMRMKLGVPYVIKNEVVEFDQNLSIAWRHLLHNVWRYELKALGPTSTLVIESWDGRSARAKWWVSDAGDWVPVAMAKSLVNLKALLENQKS